MNGVDVERVDVAVVGAGPVGLFLAREIVRRGHRVRLFEAKSGQSEHSKALAIMPRTMEAFELARVVEPFQREQNPVTQAEFVSHGRVLGTIPFESHDSRYPSVAMVPQNVTERLLVDAFAASGGVVDYEHEVVAMEPLADAVRLRVRANDGERDCIARFVVGCDGAHSIVRKLGSFSFEGGEYAKTFVLVDADTSGDDRPNVMQLCPHEDGPIAIFPMSATRRRLVAVFEKPDAAPPTLEDANAILERRGPGVLRCERLIWSSTFHIQHRQAATMRNGRVFIAGDAAHVHSPFGAQGMNTGLQDAWNLAWKLDFALRGWAGDELLDSYSAERHPIGKRVIATTDALTRAMTSTSPIANTIRDAAVPLLTRFEPFRRVFVTNLSELGISLSGSPIVDGHGSRAVDTPVLRDGRESRLYEVLDGRYLLIVSRGDSANAGRRFLDATVAPVDVVEDPTMRRSLRLVRPDSYVAFESDDDGDAALSRVDGLLRSHLTSKSTVVGPGRG